MRFLKSLAIIVSVVASTLSFSPLVYAQSALEKAFVAKSKLASPVWKKHDPASTIRIDHSTWDEFLAKYTGKDAAGVNRVSYGSVSASDKMALRDYLARLQSTDVTLLNRNEQYAFWLNLYNASVVNVVLDNYPVKSILNIKSNVLDVKGPFNDTVATVNGQKLTPDTIESGIVRPIWNDPNLHYGFNCAAVSCPNLLSKAFTGDTINAQLAQAAISFINEPRGVKLDGGKLVASKIYFWYSEDFGGENGIVKHITKYANDRTKSLLSGKTKIDRYEYDWALNRK